VTEAQDSYSFSCAYASTVERRACARVRRKRLRVDSQMSLGFLLLFYSSVTTVTFYATDGLWYPFYQTDLHLYSRLGTHHTRYTFLIRSPHCRVASLKSVARHRFEHPIRSVIPSSHGLFAACIRCPTGPVAWRDRQYRSRAEAHTGRSARKQHRARRRKTRTA
jgi:hypothetical protein